MFRTVIEITFTLNDIVFYYNNCNLPLLYQNYTRLKSFMELIPGGMHCSRSGTATSSKLQKKNVQQQQQQQQRQQQQKEETENIEKAKKSRCCWIRDDNQDGSGIDQKEIAQRGATTAQQQQQQQQQQPSKHSFDPHAHAKRCNRRADKLYSSHSELLDSSQVKKPRYSKASLLRPFTNSGSVKLGFMYTRIELILSTNKKPWYNQTSIWSSYDTSNSLIFITAKAFLQIEWVLSKWLKE
jgi:hypothetical protein